MAVVIDSVSVKGSVNSVSSPSWTHTPVGSLTGVGVGVAWGDGNANISISSVTYGGQTMTVEDTQTISSGTWRVAIYSLANPPTGAQTVQVFFSGAPDLRATMYSVGVTGGDTADVFRTAQKATGTGTVATVTVTSDTDEVVMDIVGHVSSSLTVGADQTERFNNALLGPARGCGSTEPGAASVTMSWSAAGSANWGIVAASFNPSAGTGTEPLSNSLITGVQGTETPSHTVAL